MKLRRKLFGSKDPYDSTKADLFLDACKENFDYLIGHCDDYKNLCNGLKINSSDDIKSVADLPVIPTMLFKQHDFRSGRHTFTLTSSGTSSGHKSVIRFEFSAAMAALKMSLRVCRYHEVISLKPCRYIVMGFKPTRTNKVAAARTAYLTTFLAPAFSRKFILKPTPDGLKPDFEGIVGDLIKRKKDKQVKEMLNNLKAGDRICTIGGIYGTITGLKDDTITLSVGKDNLSMVVARWAIRSVEEVTIENDAQELN